MTIVLPIDRNGRPPIAETLITHAQLGAGCIWQIKPNNTPVATVINHQDFIDLGVVFPGTSAGYFDRCFVAFDISARQLRQGEDGSVQVLFKQVHADGSIKTLGTFIETFRNGIFETLHQLLWFSV